jgi:hypothetical protein
MRLPRVTCGHHFAPTPPRPPPPSVSPGEHHTEDGKIKGRPSFGDVEMKRQRQMAPEERGLGLHPAFFAVRMTSPWESPSMAIGPLKVLRKAAEPPAGGSCRIPKTLKPTNHLRRRDGRAFILPSVVDTLRPAALNSEPAICPSSVRRSADPSSERHRADRTRARPAGACPRVTRGTARDFRFPIIF